MCAEADAEKFKGLIAKRILQDAKKEKTEMDAVKASIDMVLREGWKGNAREIEVDIRGKMGCAKTALTRLAKQMEDAEEMA